MWFCLGKDRGSGPVLVLGVGLGERTMRLETPDRGTLLMWMEGIRACTGKGKRCSRGKMLWEYVLGKLDGKATRAMQGRMKYILEHGAER